MRCVARKREATGRFFSKVPFPFVLDFQIGGCSYPAHLGASSWTFYRAEAGMKILSARRILCVPILASAILFLMNSSPAHLFAQTVTGTILGNILDPSGAAIPNAVIVITNQDTGVVRNAARTASGFFNVPSLLPGKYRVQAS